jgi:uncharacterized membrane protein YkoI
MKSLKQTTTRRRTVAAVFAATMVLGGAGAATAAAATGSTGSATQATTSTTPSPNNNNYGNSSGSGSGSGNSGKQDSEAALLNSAKVDIKQATDTAMKSVSGTATSADLEGKQGKPTWEVEIHDAKGMQHEVVVDGTTGKVTSSKAQNDHDSDDAASEATAVKNAKTTLPQAVDAAYVKVPGKATSAELESHNGKATWQVDVNDSKGMEHEVTVDATTGKATAAKAESQERTGSGEENSSGNTH